MQYLTSLYIDNLSYILISIIYLTFWATMFITSRTRYPPTASPPPPSPPFPSPPSPSLSPSMSICLSSVPHPIGPLFVGPQPHWFPNRSFSAPPVTGSPSHQPPFLFSPLIGPSQCSPISIFTDVNIRAKMPKTGLNQLMKRMWVKKGNFHYNWHCTYLIFVHLRFDYLFGNAIYYYDPQRHDLIEEVNKCMISGQEA